LPEPLSAHRFKHQVVSKMEPGSVPWLPEPISPDRGVHSSSSQNHKPRPAILRNLLPVGTHGGQALAASCTVVADYALVSPDDPSGCTNFHRTGIRVRPPPNSDPQIGASVTLLTSTGPAKVATLVGLHGQMPIGRAGLLVDVILTTPTLRGGDSGGLLTLSQTREALGLAVGFVPVASRRVISVFMPAATVMKREGGTFL